MTLKNSDYLVHYGVLGMKWGHRKSRSSSSSRGSSKSRKSSTTKVSKKRRYSRSDDAKEVIELRKKPVSALSNADLKKINQRMNLEREYRNLRKDEIDTGKKNFEQVLNYIDTANRVVSTTNKTVKNVKTVKSWARKIGKK